MTGRVDQGVANSLDVTVIVCTRNRAESLRRMLGSAAALHIPAGLRWELIIVDNGSSDTTPEVVAGFADRLPVRHVVESVAGLSHARNRGVAEARGALILWTDDDVMVDPDWLSAYVEAAERFPDAGFFGGRITPVLEEPVSALFKDNIDHPVLGSIMARRDYAEPPVELTTGTLPYGANFAVRAEWQRPYRYDPRLGVSPDHNRSGEETNFLHEIIGQGARGMSVPTSNVRHFIPASRQTRAYVRRYYAAQGETWAMVHSVPGFAMTSGPLPEGRVMLAGLPSWYWRSALRGSAKARLAELSGDMPAWLSLVGLSEHQRAAIRFLRKHGRAR